MEKFLADLKETMNGAVKKSGELVELTKMKFAISETKSKIRGKLEMLGTLAYQSAKGMEPVEDAASDLIAEIDALEDSLKEQEAKMAALSGKKVCPVCGHPCESQASFCMHCGNPISE